MTWHPEIHESDNLPHNFDNGLCYILSRIVNFQSESSKIELFDGFCIQHTSELDSPWGNAFKGDDCWTQEAIKKFKKEKPNGGSVLIDAYKGASCLNTGTFDYTCDWTNTEFYLEGILKDAPEFSAMQARLDQMHRVSLISLFILSKGSISTIKPVNFLIFPNTSGFAHGFNSGGHVINRGRSEKNKPFLMKKNDEEILINLSQQIFKRKHPEAYLASLRLLRSVNRHSLDDKVVDLVIALEALLNEGNQPGITLRVSQRLARLLHLPKAERREIARVVKAAYQMRSNLVHGSKRQFDILEGILTDNRADKKLLKVDELNKLNSDLLDLVCSALLMRYTEHKDKSQEELLDCLDDRAV